MKRGDRVSEFELPDQRGTVRSLTNLLSDGPIVLFFYPAAMTPGCTKEACHFRDLAGEFAAIGAGRVGISADAGFAVEGLRENARDRGLADAAGAGEQEGMVDLARVQGIGQRLEHVLLPDHLLEALGAPLSRQYDIAHTISLSVTPAHG